MQDKIACKYLRGTVELSARRLASRTSLETYENSEKLTAVQRNYDRILADYPGRLLTVDATLQRNDIADKVFAFVNETEPTLAASRNRREHPAATGL